MASNKTPEQEYQEYMGEVITKNATRDYKGLMGRDSYKRLDPNDERFSEIADNERQLKQQRNVDKGSILQRLLKKYRR